MNAPIPDTQSSEPRTWAGVRAAALAAVGAAGAAGAREAADIVDIVLAVCDEEALNRMASRLLEDSRMRSMGISDGSLQLEIIPATEIVAAWVGAARTLLGDAPNYVEMDADVDGSGDQPAVEMETGLAGVPERYVFRLQRRGRLTPHEARRRAEERAAAAEAELARVRELLESGSPRRDTGHGGRDDASPCQ